MKFTVNFSHELQGHTTLLRYPSPSLYSPTHIRQQTLRSQALVPEPFSLAHAAVSRTPQVLTTGRSMAECALLKHCRTANLAKASLPRSRTVQASTQDPTSLYDRLPQVHTRRRPRCKTITASTSCRQVSAQRPYMDNTVCMETKTLQLSGHLPRWRGWLETLYVGIVCLHQTEITGLTSWEEHRTGQGKQTEEKIYCSATLRLSLCIVFQSKRFHKGIQRRKLRLINTSTLGAIIKGATFKGRTVLTKPQHGTALIQYQIGLPSKPLSAARSASMLKSD